MRQGIRAAPTAGSLELSWVSVSTVCVGEYVALEEIADGIWNVYFGPLRLGRRDERRMRIEDEYGRLYRRHMQPMSADFCSCTIWA